MTKCRICGEKVPWRSLDHHNKERHPAYRRALWRYAAVVISAGIFYWVYTILFIQNSYNNYSFTLDLVYLVIIVSPIFLALYVLMLLRLTKLRRSLRAALDAEGQRTS